MYLLWSKTHFQLQFTCTWSNQPLNENTTLMLHLCIFWCLSLNCNHLSRNVDRPLKFFEKSVTYTHISIFSTDINCQKSISVFNRIMDSIIMYYWSNIYFNLADVVQSNVNLEKNYTKKCISIVLKSHLYYIIVDFQNHYQYSLE